jgi:hypothetical protein
MQNARWPLAAGLKFSREESGLLDDEGYAIHRLH